jgi:hypothetical protein
MFDFRGLVAGAVGRPVCCQRRCRSTAQGAQRGNVLFDLWSGTEGEENVSPVKGSRTGGAAGFQTAAACWGVCRATACTCAVYLASSNRWFSQCNAVHGAYILHSSCPLHDWVTSGAAFGKPARTVKG